MTPEGTLIVCADSPGALRLGDARRAAGARVERYAVAPTDSMAAEWQATALRVNDLGGVRLHGASSRAPSSGACRCACPGATTSRTRSARSPSRCARASTSIAPRSRPPSSPARAAASSCVGEAAGVTVMDDYAHHPTEVRAMVSAARQRFAGRRLVACFQPHTYSRSVYLLEGFSTASRGWTRCTCSGRTRRARSRRPASTRRRWPREIEQPQRDVPRLVRGRRGAARGGAAAGRRLLHRRRGQRRPTSARACCARLEARS